MKIKRFNKDIPLPKKSHLPDVGLDLFIPKEFVIRPFRTMTIPLGLGVAIPEGYAGMLIPRSSVAEKGLIIQTSIIDPDYIGEIHLIITNSTDESIKIEKGQRLCSLVCINVLNAYIEEVDELQSTARGTAGLGSTGK